MSMLLFGAPDPAGGATNLTGEAPDPTGEAPDHIGEAPDHMGEAPDPTGEAHDLMCCICHDAMVQPMRLECGHATCKKCLHKWWTTAPPNDGRRCPMCRYAYQLQRAVPAADIRAAVEAAYPGHEAAHLLADAAGKSDAEALSQGLEAVPPDRRDVALVLALKPDVQALRAWLTGAGDVMDWRQAAAQAGVAPAEVAALHRAMSPRRRDRWREHVDRVLLKRSRTAPPPPPPSTPELTLVLRWSREYPGVRVRTCSWFPTFLSTPHTPRVLRMTLTVRRQL